MAKKKVKKTKIVEDTFQDLDVTLNDGLDTVEEPAVVEEPVVVTPAPASSRPAGLYYKGEHIKKFPSRLGKKWVIIYKGRRVKVLRSELEVVR